MDMYQDRIDILVDEWNVKSIWNVLLKWNLVLGLVWVCIGMVFSGLETD